MSQPSPKPGHEGVTVDDIAEERRRRAMALEHDFLGTRNIPSTGLRIPEPEKDSIPASAPTDQKGGNEEAETGKDDGKS